MAISPPSDIVLDVARAVAPADLEAARAELAKAARTRSVPVAAPFSLAGAPAAPAPHVEPSAGKRPESYAKFEAMVLGSFMDSMMPKDADSVYGGGMAGGMWKSFLAQQLGDVMAKRGGIGIADRLLGDHYAAGGKTVPLTGASADPGGGASSVQRDLSAALLDQFQRNMVSSIAGGPAGPGDARS